MIQRVITQNLQPWLQQAVTRTAISFLECRHNAPTSLASRQMKDKVPEVADMALFYRLNIEMKNVNLC